MQMSKLMSLLRECVKELKHRSDNPMVERSPGQNTALEDAQILIEQAHSKLENHWTTR